MPSPPVEILDPLPLGRNRHGFSFWVGRIDGRWIGFAVGGDRDGRSLFLLPGASEGGVLGLTDRGEAILRTTAVAQDPESMFGGIDEWSVPEGLRGDPEDDRCAVCGDVCCDGEHDPEDDDEGW